MPVYFDVCIPEEGKNAGIPTEFIRITKTGGTVPDVVHRIATDEDRAKYADAYQQYLDGKKDEPEGSIQKEDAEQVPYVHPPAPGKPGYVEHYQREHGDRASPKPTLSTNPVGADAPVRLQTSAVEGLITKDQADAHAARNEDNTESTAEDDLSAHSVDDASSIINQTTDRQALTRMRAAERRGKDRKGVLEAIDARREALKNQ